MTPKPFDEIRMAGPKPNWVGDGFPVLGMFGYNNKGRDLNPFILLDYVAPHHFEPRDTPRGVGVHPHRGLETVTIIYEGELAHKDSAGDGGTIGVGDVQWMTAGKGVLHEEFHSDEYTSTGGILEMVQLWINLPRKDKMAEPRYRNMAKDTIPVVQLPEESGTIRVIAGDYKDTKGLARTFSPLNVWDISLKKGSSNKFEFPPGWVAAVLVRHGTLHINGQVTKAKQLAVFRREGEELNMEALVDVGALLIAGEPIDEPLVGYGPFVMNEKHEVVQAFVDYEHGKFLPQNEIKREDPSV